MPTHPLQPGETVVLATHNPDKAQELARFLAPFGVTLQWAAELGLPRPIESGVTCLDNARLKAELACEATGFAAVADDCGLFVEALDGRPGPHISRLAESLGGWTPAMHNVLERMGDAPRDVTFVCALALAIPNHDTISVVGRVEGTLAHAPRGLRGHGMDPVFIPLGGEHTFGELSAAEREAINHRADAFRQLKARLADLRSIQE